MQETLCLRKMGSHALERPQHLWMRVAVAMHGRNLGRVVQTYDLLSRGLYTHDTITISSAGLLRPQPATRSFIATTDCPPLDRAFHSLIDTPNNLLLNGGRKIDLHHRPAHRSVFLLIALTISQRLQITCRRDCPESQPKAPRDRRQTYGVHPTSACLPTTHRPARFHTAPCSFASIVLPAFVRSDAAIDFPALHRVTKLVTRNADIVIDITTYPTEHARKSATQARAVGVGILGFADVLHQLGHPFDSPPARLLNKLVFETVYHAALEASTELADEYGCYPNWRGSPAHSGTLRYDVWKTQPTDMYNFPALKARISMFGLRNSTLTARTSAPGCLFGCCGSAEPYCRCTNYHCYRKSSQNLTSTP